MESVGQGSPLQIIASDKVISCGEKALAFGGENEGYDFAAMRTKRGQFFQNLRSRRGRVVIALLDRNHGQSDMVTKVEIKSLLREGGEWLPIFPQEIQPPSIWRAAQVSGPLTMRSNSEE